MSRMLDAIKKPNVLIFASVGYVWLIGSGKLIATLGPPFVISKITNTKNVLSISGTVNAFQIYAHEAANKLGYTYKFVLYSLITNVGIFIPTIIVGFYVLRKKLWARNYFIGIVLVLIFQSLVIGCLTSQMNLSIVSLLNTINLDSIILMAIICVLLRKSTTDYFSGDKSI